MIYTGVPFKDTCCEQYRAKYLSKYMFLFLIHMSQMKSLNSNVYMQMDM